MIDVVPGPEDAVDRLLRATADHLRSVTAGGPTAGASRASRRRLYRVLTVAATLVVVIAVAGVLVLARDPSGGPSDRRPVAGPSGTYVRGFHYEITPADLPAGFRELSGSPFVERVPEAYAELPTRADLYRTASGARAVVVTGPHDVLEWFLGAGSYAASSTTAVSPSEVAEVFRLPSGVTAVGIRGEGGEDWTAVATSTDATPGELLALGRAAVEDPRDRPGELLESEEGGSAAAIGSALPSVGVRYVNGDGSRAISVTTFHEAANRPILEALVGDHRAVDVGGTDGLVFDAPDGSVSVVWAPRSDLLVWLVGAPGMPDTAVVRLARDATPSGPAAGG